IYDEAHERGQGYQTLREATRTIGHRMTGTENGRRAEEYAHDLLRDYGYRRVKYQTFSAEAWLRGGLKLEIVPTSSDNYATYKAVALAHSPEQADVQAPLIDLGNGLARDYERLGADAVRGMVVVANLGLVREGPADTLAKNLHRSEKTALARQHGAVGVIFINQVAGDVLLTGTASVDGSLLPLPAMSISQKSGLNLRKWMTEETLEAHIQMKNEGKTVEGRNVVARLKGAELPKERIVVGGHLDSWDLATGAIDNGIGSFTVLEIARIFKALDLKPRRTVEFVAFMGEEIGLFGSQHMVERLKRRGDLGGVRYVVNLDMAGNPRGYNAFGRPEAAALFEDFGEQIRAVDADYANQNVSRPGLHSDHQPFMLEGIPVTTPNSNLDPKVYDCYHADCDRFALVDSLHMLNGTARTAMLIYLLADAETLPTARMSSDETRDFLVDNGLKESLQLGGDWRWGE
ncbi:MAG: M20/M25/M40 family metallo-hydrolase, partial [Catalinimonas sp.]